MPTLEIFQSLWAMERRRPDGEEWPLEEKFRMLAEAGYAGACIDMGGADIPTVEMAKPLFREHGLGCTICAFPTSTEELKPVLEMGNALDARFININARFMPYTPREGADFVQSCLELSKDAAIPAYFETHRHTLTTDLLYTLQLMDLAPDLELVADLSHFVVAREFPWPVDPWHDELIDRVLRRSIAFQGRIASREQVQLPIGFAQHKGWVEQFFSWWERGFRYWRERAPDDAVLNFLCELGPAPYAITGADGYELSDRWEEALAIKASIEAMWAALERE